MSYIPRQPTDNLELVSAAQYDTGGLLQIQCRRSLDKWQPRGSLWTPHVPPVKKSRKSTEAADFLLFSPLHANSEPSAVRIRQLLWLNLQSRCLRRTALDFLTLFAKEWRSQKSRTQNTKRTRPEVPNHKCRINIKELNKKEIERTTHVLSYLNLWVPSSERFRIGLLLPMDAVLASAFHFPIESFHFPIESICFSWRMLS